MLEFYNYFDAPIRLFSNLYLTKLLDILAKSFFRIVTNQYWLIVIIYILFVL